MIDIWCARCHVTKLGWRAENAQGVTILCPFCGFQHQVRASLETAALDNATAEAPKLRLTTTA